MSGAGWVYMQTNDAIPDFVRVVMSSSPEPDVLTHDPKVLPLPSKLAAQYRVSDLAQLAYVLNLVFAEHRSSHAPEFYRVRAEQMNALIGLAGLREEGGDADQLAEAPDGPAEAYTVLSTLIAELMEDAHGAAAMTPLKDGETFAAKADQLAKVGHDIGVLAQAMAVLSARRDEAHRIVGSLR